MGVLSLVAKRLGLGLVTLLVVSIIIFGAVELLPGDLAEQILGPAAPPEMVETMRENLGLDRPAVVRYIDWLGGALQGDFGISLANKRSVAEQLGPRFANTIFLAAVAAALSIPISIVLGVLAALFRESVFDRIANVSALTTLSSPEFFLGYILILFFSVQNPWFPSFSSVTPDMPFTERLFVTLLPALTMSLVVSAHMMRMTRVAIIALLASPYIEMARIKGEPRWKVVAVHALPNALAPIISMVAINLAYLVTGVVMVEIVFVYPGVGQLLVDSVSKRDFPVVQACCLVFAATYIHLNLLADVAMILSNPRLRHPK